MERVCEWQRPSQWHRPWRRAVADRLWYQVREEIEEALGIVKNRKGQAGPSCVVGFHFEQSASGKIVMLKEFIDQEHVHVGERIAVRIMPKCVRVPPRMRSIPALDPKLSEDERLMAMQRRRIPEELVGQDPRLQKPNHVCKNCSCVGHTYRNCQWMKIKDKLD